ncbi:MAG: type VI secretion system Vgr family protein [Pseudorhodobacter sp.]
MSSQITSNQAILENRKLRMSGPLPENQMFIKAARVSEGMSKLSEISVDFMSPDKKLDLKKVVGQPITVKMMKGEQEGDGWREFMGTCVSGQVIGLHGGYGFYNLECRPWLWFLTKNCQNRIFQKLTIVDIIKKIFNENGFSDFTVNVSRTPKAREYSAQINESDFTYLSRLMEEEGIYYYSTVKNGKDHLMVVDGIGGHSPVESGAEIEFALREREYRRNSDHIFDWRGSQDVTSGKVTLNDWDFEKPKADMKVVNSIAKGSHNRKEYEIYRYPGHYRETALGDIYARVAMEAQAAKHEMRDGVGNVKDLATGATFKLSKHFSDGENGEYLIVGTTHMMQIEKDAEDDTQEIEAVRQQAGRAGASEEKVPGSIEFDEENKDAYRCTFKALPKDVPFRSEANTPWPRIPGILIAKVTGPEGEEIHTDQYGRIRVQFPWDREGKNDENSSCWVRVVTPWSGKNWGMIAVPRIGQEVVIQFEDGDPDRPICTGMLYNADTMPPYALPDNMTQQGIKTHSTKGGGTDNFNELVMEDKIGEEFVRLQSEKDYVEIIKNNATITIGMEKQDPGDYTQTIYANRSEFVKTGDSTFKVEQGNEIRYVKSNKDEDIDGNSTKNIKGDETKDTKGKFTEDVRGSYDTTVIGAVTIESKQKITLKVGANSITIDQSGITLKGIMIQTAASTVHEIKGNAVVKIQGGVTLIN